MPDLTAAARADLDYLRQRLGADRVIGPVEDADGDGLWLLTLVKKDGKMIWFPGPSAEEALAKARRELDLRSPPPPAPPRARGRRTA